MAIAIMGGLTVATLLTIFFVPGPLPRGSGSPGRPVLLLHPTPVLAH